MAPDHRGLELGRFTHRHWQQRS